MKWPRRPEDLMGFGKYHGKTVGWVTQYDPAYIVWACNNVDNFTVPDTTKAKCESRRLEINERIRKERSAEGDDDNA